MKLIELAKEDNFDAFGKYWDENGMFLNDEEIDVLHSQISERYSIRARLKKWYEVDDD